MKTRLINTAGTSRMISKTTLHKPGRDLEAERLVVSVTTNKLAARPAPRPADKATVVRPGSVWGDSAKTDRRIRDIAAARAEARREAAPVQAIKPLGTSW